MEFAVVAAFILVIAALAIRAMTRPGNRRVSSGPGPGAAGTIYDLLNQEKRKAIEIIVEGRAEKTDPETADDIPPDDEEESAKRARIRGPRSPARD